MIIIIIHIGGWVWFSFKEILMWILADAVKVELI